MGPYRATISSITHNRGEVEEWCEQNIGLEAPTDPEYGRYAVSSIYKWGYFKKYNNQHSHSGMIQFDYDFDFFYESDYVLFCLRWLGN